MNLYAPKSEFVRRRALSLSKAGESNREIARRLGISSATVDRWVRATNKKPAITRAIGMAERMTAVRWGAAGLPVLAFVPHIKLTSASKYTMRSQP